MPYVSKYFAVPAVYSVVFLLSCSAVASAQTHSNEAPSIITGLLTPSAPQELKTSLTLPQALKAAYASNPRIAAAQQQRAISETDVSLAQSLKRPTVEANASYGYLDQDNDFTTAQSSSLSGETSQIGLNLRQPLFRGFQTRNAISQAEALALAAEVEVEVAEQQVFLDVATAYLAVQRDFNILTLSEENFETLNTQLEANMKRYELKDASLTDVARSQSAAASAQSQIANVRASYAAVQSVFFRLTGLRAENLDSLRTAPIMPSSLDVLLKRALSNNASIRSARYALQASEYAVKEAKGARLPTVDLNSSLSRNEGPQNFGLFSDDRTTTAASASISVRVPIYQAGQEFDNIKRAKQMRRLREIELAQVTAGVRDESRIAWDRMDATKAAMISHEQAVKAAETAARGTRKIYRSGLISAIDLIDTEQILLNATIEYERAKNDYHITLYTILSLMGEIHE